MATKSGSHIDIIDVDHYDPYMTHTLHITELVTNMRDTIMNTEQS